MKPAVTVILMHHLDENRGYFDLALRSILQSRNVDYELIVLADSETAPEVPDHVTLVHDRLLDTGTKKVIRGVSMMHPDCTHFLLLSDDVIIHQDSLSAMTKEPQSLIQVPSSNCQQGSRYIWKNVALPQHADLLFGEDGFEMLSKGPFPFAPLIVRQDWMPFFCVLIPKDVYLKLNGLDPALETRHNDEDFCRRAAKINIPTVVNFNAFAFHFGSKTLSKSVKPDEQDNATRYFRTKWGVV